MPFNRGRPKNQFPLCNSKLVSCKVFSYKHFSIKIMREIRKELISFQNLNPIIYIRFINYSFSSKKLFLNV